MRRWLIVISLLLLYWGSRVAALDALPLHNDEGLHLERAEQVWHGHPFWEISDGKVINHWPIALLYPQGDPVMAGRMATVLVGLLGLAAGLALARRLAGDRAALLVGALWIASPYLFFFERLALSDSEAGALIVVAVWAALLWAARGRWQAAGVAGAALAAAVLFKLTAAPYGLAVALIVLLAGDWAWRRRAAALLLIGGIVAASLAVPIAYLAATGRDLGVAFGWIGTGDTRGGGLALDDNLTRLWHQLTGFGTSWWAVGLLAGLLLLLGWRALRPGTVRGRARWLDALLVAGCVVPVLVTALLGNDVRPRHFVAGLPLALILAGLGWGRLAAGLRSDRAAWGLTGLIALLLAVGMIPLARTAYDAPGALTLSAELRLEYVTGHSAGFGLREAVLAFPETIGSPGVPVIASMFPDSCKRAAFYDRVGYGMVCPAAPGLPEICAALDASGVVYILAEKPPIGLQFDETNLPAVRLAGYPRPGETQQTASVALWRVGGECPPCEQAVGLWQNYCNG